eukprot:TRINITY_DN399_c0_g1_i1.p1 TRINITY_DN399_c0_g1~~TRINITY_DN399_c0_g1_i1.p1  ORF type:complete len:526 (+),score=80.08 TRINITY_DN399_c0_g1_i1:93-1670(+)
MLIVLGLLLTFSCVSGDEVYNVVFNNYAQPQFPGWEPRPNQPDRLATFLNKLGSIGVQFSTQVDAINSAAKDYGNIVHRAPAVVVYPKSTAEVQAVVRAVRDGHLWLNVQGAQHSTQGQSQVFPSGGVAMNMKNMQTIRQVGASWVDVDAGARWSQVVAATTAQNKIPTVLTSLLEFSVGGTLSGGGLGSNGHKYGAQIDNVLQIEVVDGFGNVHTVSATQEPDLFDAVRGGLGQFGVITGARIATRAAFEKIRNYNIFYTSAATFMAESAALLARTGTATEASTIAGSVFPNVPQINTARFGATFAATLPDPTTAPLLFLLAVGKEYAAASPPDNSAMLTGLTTTLSFTADQTLQESLTAYDALIAAAVATGIDKLPHPWMPVWLPNNADVLGDFFANVVPKFLQWDPTSVVSIGPTPGATFAAPQHRIPRTTPIVWMAYFAGSASDSTELQQMTDFIKAQYKHFLPAPAFRYPVDIMPEVPLDGGWAAFHFQERWPDVLAAKAKYDPDHILGGGQLIFNVTKH